MPVYVRNLGTTNFESLINEVTSTVTSITSIAEELNYLTISLELKSSSLLAEIK